MFAGHVKFSVYWWYWKAQGLPLFAVFGVLFVIYQGVQIFANIWLSRMGNMGEISDEIKDEFPCFPNFSPACPPNFDPNTTNINERITEMMRSRIDRYLWVYFGLGFVQALFMLCYNTVFSYMAVAACKTIHAQLLGTYTNSLFTRAN